MARRTSLDRAIENTQALESAMRSIFYSAKKHGHSIEKLLADRQAVIYSTEAYKKLPRWAHSELNGYFNAMFKVLQEDWTTGMYLLDDGRLVDYSGKGFGFSVTPQEVTEKATHICSIWENDGRFPVDHVAYFSKYEVGWKKKEENRLTIFP